VPPGAKLVGPSAKLRNCDIQCSTAQIVNHKYTIAFSLPHHAHYSCNRLLHETDHSEASRLSPLISAIIYANEQLSCSEMSGFRA